MQIMANAATMKWDWKGWGMGVMGAVISGGAMGLTAIVIGVSWQKTLTLVGVSAAVSLGKFLQTHSTPDQLQEALANAAKESDKAVVQASKAADAVAVAQAAAPEAGK